MHIISVRYVSYAGRSNYYVALIVPLMASYQGKAANGLSLGCEKNVQHTMAIVFCLPLPCVLFEDIISRFCEYCR